MAIENVATIKNKLTILAAGFFRYRSSITSIAALLSGNITALVLAAIGGLMVARFLGPDETGPFRAFTIPLTYLMFLHLGTFDGLWRQLPYYIGKEDPEKVNALASAAGAFNLIISTGVCCVFICFAGYGLLKGEYDSFFGWLSQAACCWGIFFGGYLTSTYRTLHHFVKLSRILVAQSVITFGMVFILPLFHFYGLCMRAAAPPLIALWLLHRNRPLKVAYRFDSKSLKELITIGLPFSIWGSLYTNVWVATESAMVLSISGVTALGLFSVAAVMRTAVESLPMAVWQVATPRIVTAFARNGSMRSSNKRLILVTAGLISSMVVFAVSGSLLLEILVPIFIPKYVNGIAVMKLCLWFPVIQAAALPINTLFAAGKQWLYGRGVIVGLIVFAVSSYLLVPAIGGFQAVVTGSLAGRITRTLVAYVDLILLAKREA